VAFMALENLILRLEGKPTIRLNDGITSLSNGLVAECGRYVLVLHFKTCEGLGKSGLENREYRCWDRLH
jgi:hypothetical protein